MFIKHICSKIQCAYLCTQCWTHIVLYKLHAWDSHSLSINMYIFICVPYWEYLRTIPQGNMLICNIISTWKLRGEVSLVPSPPSFKIEQTYASILGRGSQCMLSSKTPLGWHWYPWKSWSMLQLGDIRETTGKGDSSSDLQKQKEVKNSG